MADARMVLADYPDMRAAVQDVKLFSSSAFKNAQLDLSLRGPDTRKLEEYAAKVVEWMKANRQVHRRGHQRRDPQPGTAGADRPRPGGRPGRGRAAASPRRSGCSSAASR